MNKTQIIFDKNKKSINIKKQLIKKINDNQFKKNNLIIVIGGDGFMLETLKKLEKYNKPFYGMNKGNFGFLMNKYDIFTLYKKIDKSKQILVSPLSMKVVTKNNIMKRAIAINEVSMFRQSRQTASLEIKCGKKILIKKLVSDGVLVSTPVGSTAYNLSVHGPILSLNSKKLAVTPISPFRPRRWKGKIIASSSVVKIKNLNIKKRPVSVVADNVEVRNVKYVSIKINNKSKFKLLYDRNSSLTKKIKLEQIRKETY